MPNETSGAYSFEFSTSSVDVGGFDPSNSSIDSPGFDPNTASIDYSYDESGLQQKQGGVSDKSQSVYGDRTDTIPPQTTSGDSSGSKAQHNSTIDQNAGNGLGNLLAGRALDLGDLVIEGLKGIPGKFGGSLSAAGLMFGALSFASLGNGNEAKAIGAIGTFGNVACSVALVLSGAGGILAVGSIGLGVADLTSSAIEGTYLGGQLGADIASLVFE